MDSSEQARSGLLSAEAKVHFRYYWQVVLERRWLVIIGFFLCLFGAALYLLRAPKIYRATAVIQIDREADGLFSQRELVLNTGREQDYLLTQYRNLQSPKLIRRVASILELEKIPDYARSLDIVHALKRQIEIAPVRLTRLVEVRVEHTNPKLATNIANTLAYTFVEDNMEIRRTRALDALRWMNTEVEDKEREVTAADEALQAYKQDNNMVSLEANQNIILQALIQAQSDLARAQSASTEATQIADDITRIIKSGTSLDTIPEISQSPTVRELKVNLAAQESILKRELTRYKDKWPTVIAARAQLASAQQSFDDECRKIYETILTRALIAKGTEKKLEEIWKTRQESMLKHNQLRIGYDVLVRKADQLKSLHNNLLARIQEVQVSSKNSVNNMMVNVPAEISPLPVKPKIPVILVLGVLGGLGLGFGLAFFVNYLDDSIKSQDDIETIPQLPFLGYVPNIKAGNLHERDLHAHLHPRSSAAESFRTLRAAISLAARADKMRVFRRHQLHPVRRQITLRLELRHRHRPIRPRRRSWSTPTCGAPRCTRPSRSMPLSASPPICRARPTSSRTSSTNRRCPTSMSSSAARSRRIPPNCWTLPRMEKLLAEFRQRYDRVVIDCPPISAVSDPLVMGAKSDGVLYVMKFKKIRREHARRSVQRIQDAGIQVVGVLLNDIDFEGRDSYYYSYYYYQNQYYSHYKTEPTSKKAESTKSSTSKS
jgi:succinoglycan biosynthesis transport protein ExoP